MKNQGIEQEKTEIREKRAWTGMIQRSASSDYLVAESGHPGFQIPRFRSLFPPLSPVSSRSSLCSRLGGFGDQPQTELLHALHLQVLSEARSSLCAVGQCYSICEGLLPFNSSSPAHDSLRIGVGTLRSKAELNREERSLRRPTRRVWWQPK